MSNRIEQINEIIADLQQLKQNSSDNIYAIECNLDFFNAAKSRNDYLKWVFGPMRKIEGDRLLELADLPLPKWDKQLHQDLSMMSRKKFPGMLKPLLTELISFVKDHQPKILIDLGCGSLEIVRQLILLMEEKGIKEKLVIVGIDKSPIVSEMVRENFVGLENLVDLEFRDQLAHDLDDLADKVLAKHLLIISKDDIFALDQYVNNKKADLVFHSRFKHHLNTEDKHKIDMLIRQISNYYIEFDEYKDLFLIPIQSLATWQMPVLMNGAVFSRLRELEKQDIINGVNHSEERLLFNGLLGTYLKTNIK